MSYRLNFDATVPEALCAVYLERLEHARAQLQAPAEEATAKAVHTARKDIKKARALLRLARPDLRKKDYARENAALREIAHSLSTARKADVLVDTMDDLSERLVGQLPEPAIAALCERIIRHAANTRAQDDGSQPDGKPARGALEQALQRASVLSFDACDADTLPTGSVTAYTRGRVAFAVARRDTTAENLHEWRKRVKDFWYHQRRPRDAWPAVFTAQADEADVLSAGPRTPCSRIHHHRSC
jgi:CHAD domain-containing protein